MINNMINRLEKNMMATMEISDTQGREIIGNSVKKVRVYADMLILIMRTYAVNSDGAKLIGDKIVDNYCSIAMDLENADLKTKRQFFIGDMRSLTDLHKKYMIDA